LLLSNGNAFSWAQANIQLQPDRTIMTVVYVFVKKLMIRAVCKA